MTPIETNKKTGVDLYWSSASGFQLHSPGRPTLFLGHIENLQAIAEFDRAVFRAQSEEKRMAA